MADVNREVLPLFEEPADALIKQYGGDSKKALQATLAYLSGHYKSVLESRSLLTGQEKCITVEMKFPKPFFAVSFVWNILRKLLPQPITDGIKGMRSFKDMSGVVFDVQEEDIERFEDVFNHLKEENRIDFEIGRAKTLPELREDDNPGGGYGGGYGNSYGGGYGN
jgi:hypothetical protein